MADNAAFTAVGMVLRVRQRTRFAYVSRRCCLMACGLRSPVPHNMVESARRKGGACMPVVYSVHPLPTAATDCFWNIFARHRDVVAEARVFCLCPSSTLSTSSTLCTNQVQEYSDSRAGSSRGSASGASSSRGGAGGWTETRSVEGALGGRLLLDAKRVVNFEEHLMLCQSVAIWHGGGFAFALKCAGASVSCRFANLGV